MSAQGTKILAFIMMVLLLESLSGCATKLSPAVVTVDRRQSMLCDAPGDAAASPMGAAMNQDDSSSLGVHDFDFLVGRWNVHHRRLKERLADNDDWLEFDGTTVMQTIMNGTANIDDNVLEVPGGAYLAASLRTFDLKSRLWSIWWLDGRFPEGPLGPPLKGGFQGGVGTFYADDTYNGKPIRVRFIWSDITPTSARWTQAFSADWGQTWETNWTMEFVRAR